MGSTRQGLLALVLAVIGAWPATARAQSLLLDPLEPVLDQSFKQYQSGDYAKPALARFCQQAPFSQALFAYQKYESHFYGNNYGMNLALLDELARRPDGDCGQFRQSFYLARWESGYWANTRIDALPESCRGCLAFLGKPTPEPLPVFSPVPTPHFDWIGPGLEGQIRTFLQTEDLRSSFSVLGQMDFTQLERVSPYLLHRLLEKIGQAHSREMALYFLSRFKPNWWWHPAGLSPYVVALPFDSDPEVRMEKFSLLASLQGPEGLDYLRSTFEGSPPQDWAAFLDILQEKRYGSGYGTSEEQKKFQEGLLQLLGGLLGQADRPEVRAEILFLIANGFQSQGEAVSMVSRFYGSASEITGDEARALVNFRDKSLVPLDLVLLQWPATRDRAAQQIESCWSPDVKADLSKRFLAPQNPPPPIRWKPLDGSLRQLVESLFGISVDQALADVEKGSGSAQKLQFLQLLASQSDPLDPGLVQGAVDLLVKAPSAERAQQVAQVLRGIRNTSFGAALCDYYQQHPGQGWLQVGLGVIVEEKNRESIPFLMNCAQSSDLNIRSQAKWALSNFGL